MNRRICDGAMPLTVPIAAIALGALLALPGVAFAQEQERNDHTDHGGD